MRRRANRICYIGENFMRARNSGGARASARFNIRDGGALEFARSLSFCTLKRRERRAPIGSGVLLWLALLLSGCATAPPLTKVFRADKLAEMDAAITSAIASHQIPGGVLWVEHNGVAYHQAFGNRAPAPARGCRMPCDMPRRCAPPTARRRDFDCWRWRTEWLHPSPRACRRENFWRLVGWWRSQ